jgi:hypothetical protein
VHGACRTALFCEKRDGVGFSAIPAAPFCLWWFFRSILFLLASVCVVGGGNAAVLGTVRFADVRCVCVDGDKCQLSFQTDRST